MRTALPNYQMAGVGNHARDTKTHTRLHLTHSSCRFGKHVSFITAQDIARVGRHHGCCVMCVMLVSEKEKAPHSGKSFPPIKRNPSSTRSTSLDISMRRDAVGGNEGWRDGAWRPSRLGRVCCSRFPKPASVGIPATPSCWKDIRFRIARRSTSASSYASNILRSEGRSMAIFDGHYSAREPFA